MQNAPSMTEAACPAPRAWGHDMHDHPLVRRLESQGISLTNEELTSVLELPVQIETLRPDQDIVREGDRPSRSCLILEGYAATYKVTPSGNR